MRGEKAKKEKNLYARKREIGDRVPLRSRLLHLDHCSINEKRRNSMFLQRLHKCLYSDDQETISSSCPKAALDLLLLFPTPQIGEEEEEEKDFHTLRQQENVLPPISDDHLPTEEELARLSDRQKTSGALQLLERSCMMGRDGPSCLALFGLLDQLSQRGRLQSMKQERRPSRIPPPNFFLQDIVHLIKKRRHGEDGESNMPELDSITATLFDDEAECHSSSADGGDNSSWYKTSHLENDSDPQNWIEKRRKTFWEVAINLMSSACLSEVEGGREREEKSSDHQMVPIETNQDNEGMFLTSDLASMSEPQENSVHHEENFNDRKKERRKRKRLARSCVSLADLLLTFDLPPEEESLWPSLPVNSLDDDDQRKEIAAFLLERGCDQFKDPTSCLKAGKAHREIAVSETNRRYRPPIIDLCIEQSFHYLSKACLMGNGEGCFLAAKVVLNHLSHPPPPPPPPPSPPPIAPARWNLVENISLLFRGRVHNLPSTDREIEPNHPPPAKSADEIFSNRFGNTIAQQEPILLAISLLESGCFDASNGDSCATLAILKGENAEATMEQSPPLITRGCAELHHPLSCFLLGQWWEQRAEAIGSTNGNSALSQARSFHEKACGSGIVPACDQLDGILRWQFPALFSKN